jgi:hypothetical protein
VGRSPRVTTEWNQGAKACAFPGCAGEGGRRPDGVLRARPTFAGVDYAVRAGHSASQADFARLPARTRMSSSKYGPFSVIHTGKWFGAKAKKADR